MKSSNNMNQKQRAFLEWTIEKKMENTAFVIIIR